MPRQKSQAALSLPVAAALLLAGCWGGESGSGGLVDNYSPKYTEAKGTVHEGDFFPLNPGEIYGVKGTTTGTVRISVSGVTPDGPVSEDTTMSMDETDSGTVAIASPSSMDLAAGTFMVYPVITTMITKTSEDVFPTAEVSTAFFEKTLSAVNIRATQDEGEAVAEPANPLFLKLPLTVGDSWEGVAEDVPEATEEGLSLDVSVRSRTFVVGMESVTLGGRSFQALRLDQVVEATASGVQEGVSTSVKGEFTISLYLQEGVGQVGQRLKGRMTANSSANQNGARLKANITMDMQGELAREEETPVPSAKLGTPASALAAALPGREAVVLPHRAPAGLSREAKAAVAARAAALRAAQALRRTALR